MWQRFSEHARRIVFFAQEEAGRQNQSEVAPEHLLLGLLRERDSFGARLLDRLGISFDDLSARLTTQLTPGNHVPDGEMRLADASKRVIDRASEEAQQLGSDTIGTEHFLLGLLDDADSPAAETLRAFGINQERIRAALADAAGAEPKDSRKSDLDALRDALSTFTGNEPRARTLAVVLDWATKVAMGREETSADFARPAPVPHTGDRGVLRDTAHTARPQIEVAADEDALFAFTAAFRARDHAGYQELLAREVFFLVPAGTRAKLLLPPRAAARQEENGFRVRVLDGEHEGRAGWVRAADFERTDSDDEPFPPAVSLEA